MVKSKKKFTDEQVAAIVKALEVGARLQRDFPEIAEDYRRGMFASEIAIKYNLVQRYGITKAVAKVAIQRALRGNRRTVLEVKPYDGLLEEDETKRLREEHSQRKGSLSTSRGSNLPLQRFRQSSVQT